VLSPVRTNWYGFALTIASAPVLSGACSIFQPGKMTATVLTKPESEPITNAFFGEFPADSSCGLVPIADRTMTERLIDVIRFVKL
jgi:hypothetical protein